jgi:hypothetical protein
MIPDIFELLGEILGPPPTRTAKPTAVEKQIARLMGRPSRKHMKKVLPRFIHRIDLKQRHRFDVTVYGTTYHVVFLWMGSGLYSVAYLPNAKGKPEFQAMATGKPTKEQMADVIRLELDRRRKAHRLETLRKRFGTVRR